MKFLTKSPDVAALLLAATVLAAGCGGQPTNDTTAQPPGNRVEDSSGDLSLTITTDEVRTGGEVAFTFTNGSTDTVTTGALDCVNYYERLDGDEWIKVQALRACIMLAQIHPPGSSSDHVTPAPESAGRYRLVVEGGIGAEGEAAVIRSAEFMVED